MRFTQEDVAPAVVHHLHTGEYEGEGVFEIFTMREEGLREVWRQVRSTLLAEWVRSDPGTRPWAWWKFDAPGGRPKVGGSGVPYEYEHDISADFYLPGEGCWDVDPDPRNPARFESQAAFLKRNELLLAGEEARVPKSGWEPEVLAMDAWGDWLEEKEIQE